MQINEEGKMEMEKTCGRTKKIKQYVCKETSRDSFLIWLNSHRYKVSVAELLNPVMRLVCWIILSPNRLNELCGPPFQFLQELGLVVISLILSCSYSGNRCRCIRTANNTGGLDAKVIETGLKCPFWNVPQDFLRLIQHPRQSKPTRATNSSWSKVFSLGQRKMWPLREQTNYVRPEIIS